MSHDQADKSGADEADQPLHALYPRRRRHPLSTMIAHVDRDKNALYFLTGIEGHREDEIEADRNVGLALADTNGQEYVSLTGFASISNDRRKIKEPKMHNIGTFRVTS
jgi:general stress protein 26